MGQHPAVSRLVKRGWAVLAATVLLAAPGCVTTATSMLHSMRLVGDDTPVCQVMTLWYSHIHTVPDSVNNGAPLPGLVGHAYLLNGAGSRFVAARGKVVVDVFDASNLTPGVDPVWIYRNEFDAGALARLKGKDRFGSECYTVFLPWPTGRPIPSHVRVNLGYVSETGQLIPADPAVLALTNQAPQQAIAIHNRKEMPGGEISPASQQGPPR